MARKVKMTDVDVDKFGIRITDPNGRVGWIAGIDGDYLLFDNQEAGEKELRKMKRNPRYSWNCTAEVTKFTK